MIPTDSVFHRPDLRNCPFCGADGQDDEKVQFMVGVQVLSSGGLLETDCRIVCTECGASIANNDDDRAATIDLWNGVPARRRAEGGE